jgi:hypothetical protein
MKQIKTYLANQKDIYMMLMLEQLKAEETNLVTIKYYLDKVIVLTEELTQLNKNNGKK